MERSAEKGGPAGGSNFWVLYRNDGQGSGDPYRVTIDDGPTFQIVAAHRRKMAGILRNRTKARASAHPVLICTPLKSH